MAIKDNTGTFLDVCQKEYELEKTRTNTIDTKATIVSAIVMGAIAVAADKSDFGDLSTIKIADTRELILLLSKLSMWGLAFFCFVASLIILLIVISMRPYRFIDCRVFSDEKLLDDEQCNYQRELANQYIGCVVNNRGVNEKRSKLYKASVVVLLVGIAIFALFMPLKIFMGGKKYERKRQN